MVKEFREFILRGNLLDLAVSVGDPTEGQALRLLHGRSGPRRLAAVCLG